MKDVLDFIMKMDEIASLNFKIDLLYLMIVLELVLSIIFFWWLFRHPMKPDGPKRIMASFICPDCRNYRKLIEFLAKNPS